MMFKTVIFVLVVVKVSCKNLGSRLHGYNYEPPGQLPEIISNDPQQFGYQYPVPNPPLFDEPTTNSVPNYLYGPPSLDLPNPNITLPPIQNDIPDFPSYIPPPATLQPPQFDDEQPNNQYLPPSSLYDNPNVQTPRLKLSNMSCLDSPTGSYFRAVMTLARSTGNLPVVDDAPADCITGSGDVYRLDLDGERMRRCGVRFCSNGMNMCVLMRVPTVRGLKLPEDSLLTLRCRPQERVVAHTKQLRLNTQNSVQQARSAAAVASVATGGSQRNFESQVSLFRRAGAAGDFTRPIAPGATVQLGEELMLRAAVRDGDGWRYSRLGDVTVHHVSAGPERRVRGRAVTLLDSAGCRDAAARAVCPADPAQPASLVTTLGLRAFMFQGMASGDEMLMTVRMIACLQYEDCHGKTRPCDDKLSTSRLRRSTNDTSPQTSPAPANTKTPEGDTNNWESFLEFRVVAPGGMDATATVPQQTPPTTFPANAFALVALVIVGFLILVVAAALIVCCRERRRY